MSERSLRLLVVTQYFWPENFQINHIVRGLVKRGHTVTVLTGKPNYPGGRFFEGYSAFGHSTDSYEGAEVIRVPLIPRGRSRALNLIANYLSFVVTGTWAALWRLRGPFDAIFVYGTSPITAAVPAIVARRRLRAPMALWVQDLWPESVEAASTIKSPAILGPLEALVRYIYRRSDSIMVQSPAFRASIEGIESGVADRIWYFPQSVDTTFRPLTADATPDAMRNVPAGFRVLFAGNVGEAQDMPTVLEAASILRDLRAIQWIIVGDGRRLGWVASEVERRGLKDCVHLLGRFPEADMPKFFAAADALLVTLRNEPIFALTIPTKVQAYLASGRPVVAGLDGEGARIVQEAGAGATARASDPAALAAAVSKLADLDQATRDEMGQRALAYSRTHFDRDMLLGALGQRLADLKFLGG